MVTLNGWWLISWSRFLGCWLDVNFTDRGYCWGLLPAGVQEGGGREAHWAAGLLPQAVRCCRSWVHFLVGFSNMNLQAIFGFEDGVTLFTLESFLIKRFFSYLFSNIFFFRNVFALQGDVNSWNFKFFLQKLFSSPGISFQSRWSSLVLLPCGSQSFLPTGIQFSQIISESDMDQSGEHPNACWSKKWKMEDMVRHGQLDLSKASSIISYYLTLTFPE